MVNIVSDHAARKIAVALVQCSSRREVTENLHPLRELVTQASAKLDALYPMQPKLILTPENVLMMEPDAKRALAQAQPEAEHVGINFFAELARQTHSILLAGSLAVRVAGDKLANRSYLFAPDGKILAKYSKIHLFDVDLANGESYRESNLYAPGDEAMGVDAALGTSLGNFHAKLGLTICYDVRFAMLYRALARAGAEILFVPAAFTATTGRAHWHVLLRARAIETGCFILAAAQTGTHAEGRQTFGHSLVVTPWGEVLADGGEAVGVVTAAIDLAEVALARRRIPSLQHDRNFLIGF
ncbi:MAG: carbon-nitrogen hydrolase family protein [Candidatus Symbiobacter sp.]|nr:carbon-nitrogen hydrolase family protein [Candidatus Symbiobacter sp.]